MMNSGTVRFGNIKEKNLKQIFRLIKDAPGISRAQIARETGLSKPAVSELTEELIASGFVKMTGTDAVSHAGRRPVCLELDPACGVFVCIALDRCKAEYRLYDFAFHLLELFAFDMAYGKGCMKDLGEIIKAESEHLKGNKVIACCVTLPAAVDSGRSELRSTVLELDPGINLIDEISGMDISDTKVIVNETIAYCYAEYTGLYPDRDNMIFVEISDGVGAGIIIDRKVFRGAGGSAGEFGHTSVDANGPVCCCGKRGCLESYISKRAVIDKALGSGIIKDASEGLKGIRDVFVAGDSRAEELYEDTAEKLAFGLGNMIAMFDISLLVLGGGIEDLGPDFLEKLRKKTDKYIISGEYRTGNDLSIRYSGLDTGSECIGAVKYFCDNILVLDSADQDSIYYV